jgi:hypothetical protein
LANGALGDCVAQYFFFNRAYAANPISANRIHDFLSNFVGWLNIHHLFFLFLLASVALFLKRKTNEFPFFAAYLLALFTSLCIISHSLLFYSCYYLIFMPLYIPAFALTLRWLVSALKQQNLSPAFRILCIGFALSFLLSNEIYRTAYLLHAEINQKLTQQGWLEELPGAKARYLHHPYSIHELEKICKVIDANTNHPDKITVVGNSCEIYLYSKRESASKYIYQFPILNISTAIVKEYESDILKTKPKLIIFPPIFRSGIADDALVLNLLTKFPQIDRLLKNEYKIIYHDNHAAIIYSRK